MALVASAPMHIRTYLSLALFTLGCVVVEGGLVVGIAYVLGSWLCHLAGV
jgi:hypothetical protein